MSDTMLNLVSVVRIALLEEPPITAADLIAAAEYSNEGSYGVAADAVTGVVERPPVELVLVRGPWSFLGQDAIDALDEHGLQAPTLSDALRFGVLEARTCRRGSIFFTADTTERGDLITVLFMPARKGQHGRIDIGTSCRPVIRYAKDSWIVSRAKCANMPLDA